MAVRLTPARASPLLRDDFPALAQTVHGLPVAYLDSAASAQKPRRVIDAMNAAMSGPYANVHRGVYDFAARATAAFEAARATVASFLNAAAPEEIVFTKNGTEAINLVAAGLATTLHAGDEILLTALEHHANIVPWYLAAQRTGAVLRVAPLRDGRLNPEDVIGRITARTKMVAVTHMSNVLGVVMPVTEIAAAARAVGARLLLDGCQAAVHRRIDVQALGCDFYVITGHKLYGPTGIGALYGRAAALEALPPYQGGGEMIDDVAFDHITFKAPPARFEAGTPPIAEVLGLAAALDYMRACGDDAVYAQPERLGRRLAERLRALPGVTVFGVGGDIVSFTLKNAHPHDVATVLDRFGIAVRAGHHCAQPLMKILGVTATLRASFALYNTEDDVDRLIEGVQKAQELLS